MAETDGGIDIGEGVKSFDFEQQATDLYRRYGFEALNARQQSAIDFSKQYLERQKVGAEFMEDPVNTVLLLGAAEILTENQVDNNRKRRIDNLVSRLVHPFVKGPKVSREEIWGSDEEGGGLDFDKAETLQMLREHEDTEATSAFLKEHEGEIDRAVAHWRDDLGKTLDVDVHILDLPVRDFVQKFRSSGFIVIPDEEDGDSVALRMILPAESTTNYQGFVRHELYHLEDYGNYVRRGAFKKILAWIDELHTEYKAENYLKDDEGLPSQRAQYPELKRYWDRAVVTLGMDFDLLGDREELMNLYVQKFGFSGFAEQALFSAGSSETIETYKTFIRPWSTALFSAGFSEKRATVAERLASGNIDIGEVVGRLKRLAVLMTPEEKDYSQRKLALPLMVPKVRKEYVVTAGVANEKPIDSRRIPAEEAAELLNSYFEAVVLLEQADLDVIKLDGDKEVLKESIRAIPIGRRALDFDLDSDFKSEMKRFKGLPDQEHEYANRMIHKLLSDTEQIFEVAFSIRSKDTRDLILSPLREEVLKMAEYAQSRGEEFPAWFVEGIHRYATSPTEIKRYIEEVLEEAYPSMIPLIQAERDRWEEKSKRTGNFQFI